MIVIFGPLAIGVGFGLFVVGMWRLNVMVRVSEPRFSRYFTRVAEVFALVVAGGLVAAWGIKWIILHPLP